MIRPSISLPTELARSCGSGWSSVYEPGISMYPGESAASSRLKYAMRFGRLRSLARDVERRDFWEIPGDITPEVPDGPEGELRPAVKLDVIPEGALLSPGNTGDIPDVIPGIPGIPDIPDSLLSVGWGLHSWAKVAGVFLSISGPVPVLSPSESLSNFLSRSVLNMTDIME